MRKHREIQKASHCDTEIEKEIDIDIELEKDIEIERETITTTTTEEEESAAELSTIFSKQASTDYKKAKLE